MGNMKRHKEIVEKSKSDNEEILEEDMQTEDKPAKKLSIEKEFAIHKQRLKEVMLRVESLEMQIKQLAKNKGR